ncbi:Na+/H+ antiporter family-domain-containing protein [Piptocephalis cylindrospora]|uniref:Na+/H+ antiporter family-domain-containing protein n=1 Tax=Piptocephalis cylindrospora TaxID=1907219 RepID=A0A4P9Y718_9FUNG|nr:Na+/H+ antiporter family-domain-containing protein [Piptocephalis cylindrospora]|eukprot:RKP14897.1 Na+/H+ antiporter family-domain-containing protein [Piptocephalis cylindrospora]
MWLTRSVGLLGLGLSLVAGGLAVSSPVGYPNITKVVSPKVALIGQNVSLSLELVWPSTAISTNVTDPTSLLPTNSSTSVASNNATISLPKRIPYTVHMLSGTLLTSGTFDRAGSKGDLLTKVTLEPFQASFSGVIGLIVRIQSSTASSVEWRIADGASDSDASIHVIPGWLTLAPVVFLITVALITKQVLLALFTGVFLSATVIFGFNPLTGFLRASDHYMVQAIADSENAKVLLFTWWLAGLIALIQRSGGAQGLASVVTRWATDRWKGLWVTFGLGCLIFFDDFASCLIVGTNMVVVTDQLMVSREKLSFFVHATSSPPASIAPLSSWIGYEVGLIAAELHKLDIKAEPFMIFIRTIPYRFYPIYMLVFLVIINFMKRDFGPMLTAERRAVREGRVSPVEDVEGAEGTEDAIKPIEGKPRRWINAILPIACNVFIIVLSIFVTGYYATVELEKAGETVVYNAATLAGNGDSYGSLIYAALATSILSIILYKVQGILTIADSLLHWTMGIKDVVEPVLILILAWAMGAAMNDLQTAEFIVSGLRTSLDAHLLPTLVFLTSCVISFVTGTSWGTMAVLFPLAVPLANALSPGSEEAIVDVVASILTGAIFGDQCSPISGTSVMSALASKCPLAAHVTTQLPYALVVAVIAIIFGYIPSGYGLFPHWVGIILGSVALVGVVWLIGSKVEDEHDTPSKLMSLLGRKAKSRAGPGLTEKQH